MDVIEDVKIGPCGNSKYIQPKRVYYKQNGVAKIWDAMKVHDAVAILLFNTSRQVFVFVKQFRPAIYINAAEHTEKNGELVVDTEKYPGSSGVTIELCAGIIDKEGSLESVAQAEVLEECGYDVPLHCFKKVTSCRGGVGTAGNTVHLYYTEITDSMRVSAGGGAEHEGELIEVIEMSIEEGRKLIWDENVNRVYSLMFGLQWFFENIWKNNLS